MPAYWMARVKIHDLAGFRAYAEHVPGILAQYNGRYLARGGRFETMEGDHGFERFVLIEFPAFEDAVACSRSAEYAAAAALRREGAAEVEIVLVDGYAPAG